jgi:hypothetical protein
MPADLVAVGFQVAEVFPGHVSLESDQSGVNVERAAHVMIVEYSARHQLVGESVIEGQGYR